MQAAIMQIIYKGICQWFLKLIVGVQFTDCRFLKKEKAVHHSCQPQQPFGHFKFIIFSARKTFMESQTCSSRRLFW